MTYSPVSPEVLDFVEAYQENRNLVATIGPSGYRIVTVGRRKYIAVDEIPTFEGRDCPGQSGRFLVDRETGVVYTIKGYGQKGYRIGDLAGLAQQYREGTATFRPEARAHTETTHSRVARWAS